MTKSLSLIMTLSAAALALALPACGNLDGSSDKPRAGAFDQASPHPAESQTTPAAADAQQPVSKAEQRGTVRFIKLPEWKPALPEGGIRDIVLVQCGMCHTPEYITLQPPLSREQWLASVTKMRTTYSGPIPEEQVPEIVDYLVAVNGAK
jgi:hypothetical protein